MNTWTNRMPKGMRLKSEGFASSLSDPQAEFTIADYCRQERLPYADIGHPVPLETFASYGRAFQKRYVPQLEDKLVSCIRRSSAGFDIRLDDEEIVQARRVVVAAGICQFENVPPVLGKLPADFVTHSSRHSELDRFQGREVAVVGAGASALDLAALLHQSGAMVHLVARTNAIPFHDPPEIPRPLWKRVRYPMTGIGSGWKPLFCSSAPSLFRRLPEPFRLQVVRRLLGPAPAWFVKEETVGKVRFHLGVSVSQAALQRDRVRLRLADPSGAAQTLDVDHVIAATGYKVDLNRLPFLDRELLAGVKTVEQTPVLSAGFESSVPGLYFVGTVSANTFGPLMRFVFGARFTARRISRHLKTHRSGGGVTR
jgi:thioredoxin reductase